MARSEPSGRETKWMVASYALAGTVFVLVLLASMGYPFALRPLVVAAAMLAGPAAWRVAARSPRPSLFIGPVGGFPRSLRPYLPAGRTPGGTRGYPS